MIRETVNRIESTVKFLRDGSGFVWRCLPQVSTRLRVLSVSRHDHHPFYVAFGRLFAPKAPAYLQRPGLGWNRGFRA